MEILKQFLIEHEKVIDLVQVVFFFIISIMLYRKTGNIKYLKECVHEMKYRTPNYNVTEKTDKKTGEVVTTIVRASQDFSKLVPIYRLNKTTNELEKTEDFIDLQEQIESYKEVALQSMLERFMPKLVDETADFVNVKGDLDMLTECFDVAEEYREKLGLDDTMSIQEVYKHMTEYSKTLADNIEKVKKGGQSEKEIVKESE